MFVSTAWTIDLNFFRPTSNNFSVLPSFYTSASLDDTLQWSDLSPAANESTLTAPTTNPICHRMAQVPYYKTMIDTKLGEKPLTEMLTALNQPIEKGDSKEDKRIRLLALLSNPDTIVPAEVIKKLSSRLLVDDLTAELSALNLSTKGDSKERKARLNDFLSQQTQAHEPLSQGVWDSETHFGYSPPPTQENPSPGRSAPESDGFRFTSPPVSKIDFLKSQQPKTKKTSLGKRKREVTNVSGDRQFNSLQSYIESLNCAKENDLNHDLEYLNLKTSGSAKVKRKRISQFVLNSATTAPSNLENRLEILEKTSLTILDKLDHISKEVDVISLTSSAAGPPTKAPSNSTGNLNALQSDLLDKLTKAYQDNVILLEKTDRSTEELKSTLRETASLHRDLEKWQNSFFKGQDSEKLDEILEIVKHKPATSTLISSVEGKHPPTTTNNTLVARSPQDTRTNQDLPGSNNTSNQARDSYRRPGFTKSKNPAKAKPAKRKRKTPKPLKVALLTDAIMQGFKAEEFPKRYDVKTINKRSIEALSRNLAKTSDDIAKGNPDAVYIHLGTQDILKDDSSPGNLAEELIQSIDKILRDTSQSCKIIVSHVISCGKSQSKASDFSNHLTHRIAALKNDHENAVLWNRVSENPNSNFLANGSGSPYKYLFVNDMVHLNQRGVKVIMGNFRTKLNNSLLDKKA